MVTTFLCGAQEKPHRESEFLIDIGAAIISGTMKVHVSHAISRHWTVEGGAGACLSAGTGKATEDEKAHEAGFGGEEPAQETGSTGNRIVGLLYAAYWPLETYKGPYVYAGCSTGNRTGPDMVIGAGYSIRIWNRLTVKIFTRLDLAATSRSGRAEGESLTLGIGYVF